MNQIAPLARWSGEWHVVNTFTGESLESHAIESRALTAAGWCNEHETRYGRAAVYSVERHPIDWRRGS